MDKALHAAAGLLIYWLLGILAVFIAAAGKEIIDYRTHGKPDWLDFLATIAIPVIIEVI